MGGTHDELQVRRYLIKPFVSRTLIQWSKKWLLGWNRGKGG